MATAMEETTDLLQHLIRNECVNDGTPASGHEVRSVDTLVKRLRRRIESDPANPQLLLTVWGVGYKFADLS